MTSKPELGYWDIRGYGNPIRMLFAFVGQEFTDKRYSFGEDNSGKEWYDIKFDLGLTFPNLPYLIDGDYKITQSQAIMRYLGRKYNLCATTEKDRIQEDMLVAQARDVYGVLGKLIYSTDVQGDLPAFKEDLPARLKMLDSYLGEKTWFLGDKITHVDFALFEVLDAHRLLFPSCMKPNPSLQKFLDRFEALPPIKAYMESKQNIKAPLMGRKATILTVDSLE